MNVLNASTESVSSANCHNPNSTSTQLKRWVWHENDFNNNNNNNNSNNNNNDNNNNNNTNNKNIYNISFINNLISTKI